MSGKRTPGIDNLNSWCPLSVFRFSHPLFRIHFTTSLSAIIIVKKAGLSSWQKVHTPKSRKALCRKHYRVHLFCQRDTKIDRFRQNLSIAFLCNSESIQYIAVTIQSYNLYYSHYKMQYIELTPPQYTEVLKKHNMIGTARRYSTRFAFCDAAKVFSYCFDELGFMYKCWNDIGNRQYAYDNVLNVNSSGQLKFISQNALDYLANSFPDDEECLVLHCVNHGEPERLWNPTASLAAAPACSLALTQCCTSM